LGLSRRLARIVVAHPGRVLLGALALTLMCAPLVARLRLSTDVLDLFPQRSPEAQAFARYSRAFVAEQELIALVESDDPARLTEFADRWAAALKASPLVSSVRHRLTAGAAAFVRDHLLMLLTDEEFAQLAARLTPDGLRAQARRLRGLIAAPGGSQLAPILTADPLEALPLVAGRLSGGLPVDATSGYFRSADGRALLVFIRPRASAFDAEADRALINEANRLAVSLGGRPTEGIHLGGAAPEVSYTGACAFALYYRDWLHRDTQLSTTLSATAVLVLFAVFFRTLRVLPLVGLPLLLGLVWTAAAAALLYHRVNAVSLAFGTILLSIGIDLPIQLYNRLREELATRPPLEALEVTVRELAGPSLTATLGPAAVFFACSLSDYRGLGELGVLAGVGLILNLGAMLTVFPALLARLPPRLWARPGRFPTSSLLARLGAATARRPRLVLAIALLAGLAALPAAARVRFDRHLIAIQPEDMPPARVQKQLQRRFGGRDKLVIALVEDEPERALERADAWLPEVERLRRAGLIRGYESAATLFPSEATQAARRRRLEAIDPPRVARELRSALEEAGFDLEPFEPFLRQLVAPPSPIRLADAGDLAFLVRAHVRDEPDGRRLVATYVYPADGEAGARALDDMRHFAAGPADGVVTGSPVLEGVLRRIVERDTIKVTVASAILVALLLAVYYRRLRPWTAVMLPLALAWVGFAAALALFRLPLNLFNLLSVPLVIGYGIDDHVFLVHRHQAQPDAPPGHALATTGRAIVLTSLSTMAGFAALGVARMDGLRLLGLSGALAVALCLLAAFAVLPALLGTLSPSQPRDTK
jgi:predicted RND superfamily exporter protein